jgi:hypothetical protein
VILVQVINDANETTDFIDCARNVDINIRHCYPRPDAYDMNDKHEYAAVDAGSFV